MANGQPRKIFISYSWDDDAHKKWVRDFAVRLRRDGLEVILDQWNTGLGDQLTRFMEWAVRESDFVLCVCTPRYKEKSDSRNGGVGYEGYIMTSEFFSNPNQRKFIPVLRKGEWINSAPSWLSGIVYADLRGDLYSERNYEELLSMLKDAHSPAPFEIQASKADAQEEISDFVNREIELATLDPLKKLPISYWQCALISAPAGYGKSRFLARLVEDIRKNPDAFAKWNWRHVDMSKCDAPGGKIAYFWEQICNRPFESDLDLKSARKQVCEHILMNLSSHPASDSPCGVLLLIDSLDDLTPETEEWLFRVFNEVVTGSYTDYAKGKASFPVRLILTGRDIEAFWPRYRRWEKESGCRYYLRSENLLVLSAFKKKDVEDLIDRKRKIAKQLDVELDVSATAERLLYLSGGHPAVINGILDELIRRKFLGLDDYLGENIERLIHKHISEVVRQIFKNYTSDQQRDIKTVLVFRMVTLDTLAKLRAGNLISWKDDNATFIGFLCSNQFLHYERKMSCYRDDILRRISYLDFAFATCEHTPHIQAVHKCALEHYETLIDQPGEQKSAYFVEWLFHALQVADVSKEDTILRWKLLLSRIRPGAVLPSDLRKDVEEEFRNDIEIRYLCRKLFGSEDATPLLKN
jgi:hypothetical protein